MPTTLVVPVACAGQLTIEKESYFTAIIPVGKLPFDKLPLDANLRRANNKSSIVRGIVRTLTDKPKDLLKSNRGIVLIAEKCYFKYDAVGNPTALVLTMLTGLHGVADGGHTLAAIQLAWRNNVDLSEAYLRLQVNVGAPDPVVRESVVHLNTSEKVDRRSVLNKYGKLDNLKQSLEELGFKQINYYQNQAKSEHRREDTRQSIIHVVKLLVAVDRKRFNPDIGRHPVSVMGGGGSGAMAHKAIERAEVLITDFLPILVRTEKMVCQKAANDSHKLPGIKDLTEYDSLMTDGTPIRCKIPSTFALPIIAALRVLIDDEDNWRIPINEILPEVVDLLWKEYSNHLRKEWEKDRKNLGGILRHDQIWILLCNAARNYHIRYLERREKAGSGEFNGRVPSLSPEKSKV